MARGTAKQNQGLSQRIATLLASTGLETRAERADLLGVHPGTLDNYLRGRVPEWDILLRIADTLGCTVDWLLTGRIYESVPDEPVEAPPCPEMADWPYEIAGPVQTIIENWDEMAPEVAPVVAGLLDRAGDMARRRGYFDWIDAPARLGRVGLTRDERRDLSACAEILRHGGPPAKMVRDMIANLAEMVRPAAPRVSENVVPLGRVAEPPDEEA